MHSNHYLEWVAVPLTPSPQFPRKSLPVSRVGRGFQRHWPFEITRCSHRAQPALVRPQTTAVAQVPLPQPARPAEGGGKGTVGLGDDLRNVCQQPLCIRALGLPWVSFTSTAFLCPTLNPSSGGMASPRKHIQSLILLRWSVCFTNTCATPAALGGLRLGQMR